MAQPGVAEGNGVAEPQTLEQPAPSPQALDQAAVVGAKRKRDEEGEDGRDGVVEEKGSPSVNGVVVGATRPNEKELIHAIYQVLKEYVDFPAWPPPNDFIALTLCPV